MESEREAGDDSKQWPTEKVDAFLDRILPVDSDLLYWRTCAAVSREVGHQCLDGHCTDRFLWGLAVCSRSYAPVFRLPRTGMRFSYVEDRIMRWAFSPEMDAAASKVRPTNDYISGLLQRPVGEIVSARRRIFDHGVSGFLKQG